MQGNPTGWPGVALPARTDYVPPGTQPMAAPPAPGIPTIGDVDNDAQWTSIYIVGGLATVSIGLLALVSYLNERDHRNLEERIDNAEGRIEGVDHRLFDYVQAHTYLHQILQAEISGLKTSRPQTTLYGEPLLVAPPVPSPAPPPYAIPPTYVPAIALPPMQQSMLPPMYTGHVPTMRGLPQAVPPSIAPPAALSASSRPTFVLPKHLESAVVSAGRASQRAAKRDSHIATQIGV